MTAFAEKQTEWIIDNNLVNKGWRIDGNELLKNVFYQKSPYKEHQKKLNENKTNEKQREKIKTNNLPN